MRELNPSVEFANKTGLAYSAVCKPLCQKLHLPQTAFDILMFLANNPNYTTARDIVGSAPHQGEPCLGECGQAGAGGLSGAPSGAG